MMMFLCSSIQINECNFKKLSVCVCAQKKNRNAPICQIYPLLFRSHAESTGQHNDKTDNSDHIVQVLFSAHSAEAAIYVLVMYKKFVFFF